jgi:Tfp pilus assembly protein PilF
MNEHWKFFTTNLAVVNRETGDLEKAKDYYERPLEIQTNI